MLAPPTESELEAVGLLHLNSVFSLAEQISDLPEKSFEVLMTHIRTYRKFQQRQTVIAATLVAKVAGKEPSTANP